MDRALTHDLREHLERLVLEDLCHFERRAIVTHLGRCDACRHAADELVRTIGELTLLARPERPTPELWNKLRDRIRLSPR